ncbi:Asparagine synthetase domain-containing protein 1 OS=Danio rerio GN=asnsd1 PE=2 SV=1 [Rhizoctonia solani AG-1 IB]|uniref:Asparagine synthetase domain-containing protein 1 n=1 Tax=Thanatephorus cucumeris (strain AG1-IB / isolate 7/3/14) TaxID=1108050 RepID=A0A0B7FI56_THACB|nr:Asparagine synthetase domain-containing protein 1 OS=Danio rerio GN=asnsd1 PE=2 SV=1 [Rhizoctonia solani AG-1 IB]
MDIEDSPGMCFQPHIGSDGSIFAWNGEIFHGIPVHNNENDGLKLFNMIQSSRGDIDSLATILSELEGPYAFAYLHKSSQMLYFARDPLGQRSLLLHLPTPSEPIFLLCSASNHRSVDYEEISTSGIYSISLKGDIFESAKSLTCTPRVKSAFDGWKTLNRIVPSEASSPLSIEQVEDFISRLDDSVKSRVENIPSNNVDLLQSEKPVARVGVLFSGGIDSSVVAYLTSRHVPRDEPIDLLNVGFENPRTLNASQNKSNRDKKKRKKGSKAPDASRTASDSIVSEGLKTGTYNVPDRLTGLEQLDELRKLCPYRKWNFVCVDISYEECKQEEPRVMALMHPSNTVMDLSLANALYFASRGKGVIYGSEGEEYVSPAKVLLSGLGSDELLGGYSRHKIAYNQGGWDGLVSELQLDLDRLPTRNLGRDDRVISANGRESRYPFLSLVLVSYLAQLPVEIKVDPRLTLQKEGLGAGLGDKTLLRLAAERLGLVLASKRTKRAMQFGSRSARMDSGAPEKKGHVVLE